MEFRFRRLQGVIVPQAVSAGRHESGLTQVREMPRRGRLRDFQDFDQVPDAHLSIQEQVEDAQPRRVGKRTKHEVDLRRWH